MVMKLDELLYTFAGEESMKWGVDTALKSIGPNAKFTIAGTEIIQWECPDGIPCPTWDEVMAECERHRAISDYYKYAYDRAKEFPQGFKQLDMLWDDIDSGKPLKEGKWYNTIKEVKEKYPKPEGPAPE
jgi:hypothetical protein